ncbi:hypothetical protein TrVE_jg1203 [Triparma verrucosa]|uniref:Glucose-methanol-choline oxidoreductase N-terminal domain-containing protein n=1 Tax=Triparma verrucosa TaxID=1606542 RepID=A0A9W7C1V6_9STRA|nr:hypothetical protein TrVE_jg1203 [Triparma verrucosa]
MHNAMLYVRGRERDFKGWGWRWEDVLEGYKRIERYVGGEERGWRGREGEVVGSKAEYVDAVGGMFVESCRAKGLRIDEDGFNDPGEEGRTGCGVYDFNVFNGTRQSVARAVLGEKRRRNLHVVSGSEVRRVLFSKEKGKQSVRGVEFINGGEVHVSLLKSGKGDGEGLGTEDSDDMERGVILTAGAIMTPQIMANSGLWEHGDVAKLKGVGKNLQDHPVVGLIYEIDELNEPSVYTISTQLKEYGDKLKNRESAKNEDFGVLGTPGLSSGGFFKSPYSGEAEDSDIQVTVFPRVTEPHITSFMKNKTNPLEKPKALFTVALLRPDMRSKVVPGPFNSSSASKKDFPLPTIEVDVPLSERDVNILKWGIEHVREILKAPPISTVLGDEYSPNKNGDELRKWIKANHLPNSHWVGSTKMGQPNASGNYDEYAVVDEKLRVLGVKGLMIADAGIMPNVPNGNVHSTVCVVGRRAGEFIVGKKKDKDKDKDKKKK